MRPHRIGQWPSASSFRTSVTYSPSATARTSRQTSEKTLAARRESSRSGAGDRKKGRLARMSPWTAGASPCSPCGVSISGSSGLIATPEVYGLRVRKDVRFGHLERVQASGAAAQAERAEPELERRGAAAIEEVGVVEVDVDELRVERADERADEHPDRVRRRELLQRTRSRLERPRRVGGESSSIPGEIGRAEAGSGAVAETGLGEDGSDLRIHVPAAAAEEARLEVVGAQPVDVAADARRRLAGGGARVIRGGPVGV